jgi:hypothetical protein
MHAGGAGAARRGGGARAAAGEGRAAAGPGADAGREGRAPGDHPSPPRLSAFFFVAVCDPLSPSLCRSDDLSCSRSLVLDSAAAAQAAEAEAAGLRAELERALAANEVRYYVRQLRIVFVCVFVFVCSACVPSRLSSLLPASCLAVCLSVRHVGSSSDPRRVGGTNDSGHYDVLMMRRARN